MTAKEKLKFLRSLQKKRKNGTSVTFLPDITVFKGENGKPGIKLDPARLRGRMDELAYLNPGLVLTLNDNRAESSKKKKAEVFYHAGGLEEYSSLLCKGKTPLIVDKKKKTTKKTKKIAPKKDDPISGMVSEDGSTILITGTSSPDKGPPR